MPRIFLLEVPQVLQPASQAFSYPRHSHDYGIEQDFLAYLKSHPEVQARSAREAEWHYLPVFWTRWHLNHDYGRHGRDELQAEVGRAILDDSKTVTVCQYDDGPLVDIGGTKTFLGSRKVPSGHDAPLLCARHRRPWWRVAKRYRGSFCGRLGTHPLRQAMADELAARGDVSIIDGDRGGAFFVRHTLASRIALAPRGYGGSSFRFYEAMQLGVTPLLIGDIDTRPFKVQLPWDKVSLYASTAKDVPSVLDSHDDRTLDEMGRQARMLYDSLLSYGRWCDLLLQELEVMP